MTKGRVSVLVPARQEPQLVPTVRDCLKQATGDVEVIVALDGYWPTEFVDDKRVHYLHWGEARGLRPSLNAARQMATGEFLFKIDGHVALAKGYDVALKAVCGESDVCVPAKRSLDVATWTMHREPWHYYWITFPWDPEAKTVGFQDRNYGPDYNALREAVRVDDIISYQGSAWMLRASHWARILPEGMDERYYWSQEPIEIGFKTWLSGGRCRIVKDVEYGHLAKGSGEHKRQFRRLKNPWDKAMEWGARYWLADSWPQQTRKLESLIDQFMPMPGWPSDWRRISAERTAC